VSEEPIIYTEEYVIMLQEKIKELEFYKIIGEEYKKLYDASSTLLSKYYNAKV